MASSTHHVPPGTGMLLRLPGADVSVARARHAVADYCRGRVRDAVRDDALLLTSELVTNACQASSGNVEVAAHFDDTGLLVTVTDDSGEPIPPTPRCVDVRDVAGRGLFLLDQIAGTWGHFGSATSKTVWFCLP